MLPEFVELMTADVEDVFLKDMAHKAIYTDSTGNTAEIVVQFFAEAADGADTLYNNVFCKLSDTPNLKVNDTFTVGGVDYGVVDFEIDEHRISVQVFLNEV